MGLELSVNRTGRAWSWWASYSLAEVTDTVDGIEVPRSWDQRHSLQAGLTWNVNNWDFSVAGLIRQMAGRRPPWRSRKSSAPVESLSSSQYPVRVMPNSFRVWPASTPGSAGNSMLGEVRLPHLSKFPIYSIETMFAVSTTILKQMRTAKNSWNLARTTGCHYCRPSAFFGSFREV